MELATKPSAPELKVRKIMGRTFLNENRLAEALEVLSGILRDYPDDSETLVTLGNLYLASGDGKSAEILYRQALELDPANQKSLLRQIELAKAEATGSDGEPAPTDPKALSRLLQRLTGDKGKVGDAELWKAADILNAVIHSDNPAEQVASRLDEFVQALPALLEINIREAASDGNADVEASLRSLQETILLQMESHPAASLPSAPHPAAAPPAEARAGWKVLFLYPEQMERTRRSAFLQDILKSLGCTFIEDRDLANPSTEKPDLVLACNPHLQPSLVKTIAACSAVGVPVIVDLDENYEQMPIFHPDYFNKGLNILERSRAYTAALMLANRITVPGEEHAVELRAGGHPAVVVPDGWSKGNLLWTKSRPTRSTINIGWANAPGQMEDLAAIRRAVLRVLREFQNTQLVIIGDLQAYRLFGNLPEERKIYLPASGPDEYPYLLSQVDILLVPLRNHPFNNSIADSVLMEAGAKSLPWIATPAPAFVRWASGGKLANALEDWHLQLRQMVSDAHLREALAREGHQAALGREKAVLQQSWYKVIYEVMAESGQTLPKPGSMDQTPAEIWR